MTGNEFCLSSVALGTSSNLSVCEKYCILYIVTGLGSTWGTCITMGTHPDMTAKGMQLSSSSLGCHQRSNTSREVDI